MCTEAHLLAKDNSITTTRSMEYGTQLNSHLVTVPKGTKIEAEDFIYECQYNFAYMNSLALDNIVTDGMNDQGLSIGALYLPFYTKYPKIKDGKNISNLQFGSWVLSQFSTVRELLENDWPNVFAEDIAAKLNLESDIEFIPLHFSIHDATGESLVIEYVKGKPKLYSNIKNSPRKLKGPYLGVLSNAPTYDWHIANLGHYSQLSPEYHGKLKPEKTPFNIPLNGIGLIGLPGDTMPASRFVQTWTTMRLSKKAKTSEDALVLAQKILNRVDLPLGLVYDEPLVKEPNQLIIDLYSNVTQWAVIREHTTAKYYFRSYHDMSLKMIDLKNYDFGSGKKSLTVLSTKSGIDEIH